MPAPPPAVLSPSHDEAAQARLILLLSLAAFASAASLRACDALLPALARGFQVSTGQAARTISMFALAYGMTQMLYGPLGDRYGKIHVVAAAASACVLASIGAMFSPGIDWLIGFRAVGGATAAAIIPLSMAWIGDRIAYEHRQATLARFLVGQMLGIIGGQFLGGVFADHLGWRWTFGFLAAVYLAASIALWTSAEDRPAGGASVGFVRRVVQIARAPWPRVIFITVFFEGIAVFGALAFVPFHLHHRFGISLTLAGLAPGAFGLGGIAYATYARRLLAHFGEAGLVRMGALLLAAALCSLALGGSWLLAIPESALLGIGYYMLHNTLQTHATQMAPANRGTAVSLFASCFFLGQSVGVSAAAQVVDSSGPETVFVVAAVMLLAVATGFVAALHRRVAAVQ